MFLPLELGCLSLLPLDPNISSVYTLASPPQRRNREQMKYSDPEGAMISNQAPEEETYKMVVLKWSDKLEGSGDNIYSPLCGG